MRAHCDLSDTPTITAFRDNELEIANAGPPNVAPATTNLFKSAAHDLVWPEAIQNSSIRLEDDLWLHRGVVFGLREKELSGHQMFPGIQQIWRR